MARLRRDPLGPVLAADNRAFGDAVAAGDAPGRRRLGHSQSNSLTRAGSSANDRHIERGLGWFIDNQEATGLWNAGRNGPKDAYCDLWVALAVCRVRKRGLGADVISVGGAPRAD